MTSRVERRRLRLCAVRSRPSCLCRAQRRREGRALLPQPAIAGERRMKAGPQGLRKERRGEREACKGEGETGLPKWQAPAAPAPPDQGAGEPPPRVSLLA